MRRRRARNGFSPRETLSLISASTPQRTSLSNVRINVSCFSETQAAVFLACFCRNDRLPKQTETRNKLSGYLTLSSDICRSATCLKKSSSPVLPAASSFSVSNPHFSNLNRVLSLTLSIFLPCIFARFARRAHRAYASSYFLPCPCPLYTAARRAYMSSPCFARFCVLVSPLIPITPLYSRRLS